MSEDNNNNAFQILIQAFIWSLIFSLIYYGIQRYLLFDYGLMVIIPLIFGLSYLISVIFGLSYKNKDSSCSNVTIWLSSIYLVLLMIVPLAVGIFGATLFESDFYIKYSFGGNSLESYFKKENPSVAVNIALGFPIILLLVWRSGNNPNCS